MYGQRSRDAAITIPDDWSIETGQWNCIQIQWPNSPSWTAILLGILSAAQRGRFWDEKTGIVTDAQAIGREIFARNADLTSCEGDPLPLPPPDQIGGFGGSCFEDCEDTMPCLDISHLLKIENGKLYALDGCCVWQEIGPLGAEPDLGETPLEIPGGDPPAYNACAKAYAGARILRDVAFACWEQYDSYPWEFVPLVEEDVKQDLVDLAVVAAVLQAGIMSPLGYTIEEVCSDSFLQWLRCQLNVKFADNAATATEDDFKSARSLVIGHVTPDVYKMNFWDYVFTAIGWKTFARYIALGAAQDDVDCDCPEEQGPGIPPTTGAWWSGLVEKTGLDGTLSVIAISSNFRKITLRWTMPAPGAQFTDLEALIGLVCPANLTSITLVLTGDYPLADWHVLPFDRWDNPHIPSLDGVTSVVATPGFQGSTGSVWSIAFDSGKPTAYEAAVANSFRFLPGDTREAGASCEFSIEITSWS